MHEYDQPPPLSNAESERGSHVADLSTVQLIERLTTQVSTLVRTEIDAGLAEVKSKGSRLGVGVGISGAGALLLFLGLAILTVGLGFTYGPQAALYAELFPASIRFSGVSISYAIGAILGGAFAPTIATALVQATGTTASVTWYLVGMTLLGLIATLLLRDRSGIPLGPDHEEEQAQSPIYGVAKA